MRAKTLSGQLTVALPGATVLWDGRVLGRTDEALVALNTAVALNRELRSNSPWPRWQVVSR